MQLVVLSLSYKETEREGHVGRGERWWRKFEVVCLRDWERKKKGGLNKSRPEYRQSTNFYYVFFLSLSFFVRKENLSINECDLGLKNFFFFVYVRTWLGFKESFFLVGKESLPNNQCDLDLKNVIYSKIKNFFLLNTNYILNYKGMSFSNSNY